MSSVIQSFKRWVKRIFGSPSTSGKTTRHSFEDGVHVEPKYWPEVMHFIDNINNIIHLLDIL
jgi:hypothetical protein